RRHAEARPHPGALGTIQDCPSPHLYRAAGRLAGYGNCSGRATLFSGRSDRSHRLEDEVGRRRSIYGAAVRRSVHPLSDASEGPGSLSLVVSGCNLLPASCTQPHTDSFAARKARTANCAKNEERFMPPTVTKEET